jgi:hypothetical protein
VRGELAAAVPGVNIAITFHLTFPYSFTIDEPYSARMEAVASLSLAANIFQVVGFASKLWSTGQQTYQAGSTVENAELEVVVKDFQVLNRRLRSWSCPDPECLGPLSEDDQVRLFRIFLSCSS